MATSDPLFSERSGPRYAQLADLLRHRIVRGDWSVGEQLPTLDALKEEFGLARVTIRQALELLEREGLIARLQGRGTFVTAAPKEDRWLKVRSSIADLTDVFRGTTVTLLAEPERTGPLELEAGEGRSAASYVRLRRVHSHDGAPYCVIDIHVEAAIYAKAPKRFPKETVISVLCELPDVRIVSGRQTLTIHAADVELSRLLRVPINAPIAEVRRTFVDAAGTVIYFAEASCRGDFVHVEMEIKP